MKKVVLFFTFAIVALQGMALYDVTVTDRLHVWAKFPDEIIADGQTVNYIKVYQHDDGNISYCAFNMEFILPEGFRVNQIRQGREMVDDIFFSDRATSTHTISCNIVDGIDLRIIGDSSQNLDFYNDDVDGNELDELFTVGLIAEKTLLTGNYDVTLTGIKFCLSNADARVPQDEPINYKVYVNNPDIITGIAVVSAEMLDKDDCYDLSGCKVDPRRVHNTIVICKGEKFFIR